MWRRSLAFVACFLLLGVQAFAADCDEMTAAVGKPQLRGDIEGATTLCRLGYQLAHDQSRKTPYWVVERLTPTRFAGSGDREGDPFAADPDLPEGSRAELEDYKGSGFDRGHMAPAADMKFSQDAMVQSFYLSNMAPQVGIGLNRDIWADLEQLARTWTCERGELVVFTGPIFAERPKSIGEGKVAVPEAFYKIVFDPGRSRALAFILPNKKIDKKGRRSWEALQEYRVSILDVEAKSGVEFFTALPARQKNILKRAKSNMWADRGECRQ